MLNQNEIVMDWSRLEMVRSLQEDGEADLVAQLVGMFTDDGACRLTRMREAQQRGDAKSLKREAHSLKGTAGLIGATSLQDRAAVLEREAGNATAETIALLIEGTVDAYRSSVHALTGKTPGNREESR